jgi:hypothetical protein
LKPLSNEPAVQNYQAQSIGNFSFPSKWLRMVVVAIIGLGLVFASNRIEHDTMLTLTDTRPVAQVAGLVMGIAALWGVLQAGRAFAKQNQQIAWRTSLRIVGWIGFAGSAVGLAVFMFQSSDAKGLPIGGAVRTVGSLIPLVIGIQSAFLLSPDDEPGMEVLLACPRPVHWVLLERFAVIFLSQAALALIGMGISMAITGEREVLIEAVRWLPTGLMFCGLATYITLASRQPAFSVAMVGILWFTFNIMGNALLPGQPTMWPLNLVQPFVWAIHPYLQPGDLPMADWWLNRALVASVGIILIMLTARQLQDEERVLLGGAKAKKRVRGDS